MEPIVFAALFVVVGVLDHAALRAIRLWGPAKARNSPIRGYLKIGGWAAIALGSLIALLAAIPPRTWAEPWASPTLGAGSVVLGTIVAGVVLQAVASTYQRREDKLKVRRELIVRFSALTSSMHYRLQHFAWRDRHGAFKGMKAVRAAELTNLESRWLDDRAALAALHNETDAYFGKDGPGRQMHRVVDLLMLNYVQRPDVGKAQYKETIKHLVEPIGHTSSSLGR